MIDAIFSEVIQTVTLTGLFQWDYGQKLQIKGLTLGETMEVHFSNVKDKEAVVMVATKQGDSYIVDIPNILLEKSLDIIAWIYAIGSNSGETVKTAILKVEPRIKPQDFVSQNPDAQALLDDVLNKINNNIKDNAEFKQNITTQQTNFENKINNEWNTYKSNLTQQQTTFEKKVTDTQKAHETTVATKQHDFEKAQTERQNAFEKKQEGQQATFEENLTQDFDKFKHDVMSGDFVPAGTVFPFAGQTIPNGFVLCQGQELSRATYKRLFDAIGTTYGSGDGSTTFNVPNLSAAFPLGANSTYKVGQKGGEEKHTLTTNEMPSHTHTQNAHSHSASSTSAGAHTHSASTSSNGSHSHSGSGTTGSGGAHDHTLARAHAGSDGYNYIPNSSPRTTGNTADGVYSNGAHTHSFSFSTNTTGGHSHSVTVNSNGAHSHSISVGNQTATNNNTGGGQAHNNMPPYLAMNFIIKY